MDSSGNESFEDSSLLDIKQSRSTRSSSVRDSVTSLEDSLVQRENQNDSFDPDEDIIDESFDSEASSARNNKLPTPSKSISSHSWKSSSTNKENSRNNDFSDSQNSSKLSDKLNDFDESMNDEELNESTSTPNKKNFEKIVMNEKSGKNSPENISGSSPGFSGSQNNTSAENEDLEKKIVSREARKSYRELIIENSDSDDEPIHIGTRNVRPAIIDSDSEDDVIVVPQKEEVIAISSGEDTNENTIDLTQKLNQTTFKQTTLDNIVKRTPIKVEKPDEINLNAIKTGLNNVLQKENINTNPQGANSEAIYCTQKEYTLQATRVANLRTDLKRMKFMWSTIKNKASLPDGGANLKQREMYLEQELLKEDKILSKMIVEDSSMDPTTAKGFASFNWEQIQAGSAAVIPHTWGKKAMETHNIQKALTMDRLKALHGSLSNCPGEDDLEENPKYLKVELMPHQKRALAWLLWREKQKPAGGILADDMGLGKTLTMISLVMKSKELSKDEEEEQRELSESDKENDEDDDEKKKDKRRTKMLPQGGTLVICPASLLQQWEGEVERHTKRGIISIELYHGNNRENKPLRLAKQDIVVTTYNLAMRECEKKGPLYRIRWRRIILDEAHVVRNYKSQTSIAMCSLKGKSCWALTGTPVHNKELDLYALMKFLRCSPFDDLTIWKRWVANKNASGQDRLNMVMQTLMLRRTKAQLQESCATFKLPEKKYEVIDIHLDKRETQLYQKILVFSRKLFQQFLDQRNEKNKDYRFHEDRPAYSQNEKSQEHYDAINEFRSKLLRTHGKPEVKSHQILVLLLRLRQICCHPNLITGILDSSACEEAGIVEDGVDEFQDFMDKLKKLDLEDSEPKEAPTVTNESNQEQEDLNTVASKLLNPNDPIFKEDRRNQKIEKVIDILKNRVIAANDKAVVVSQWTSMLRLVNLHCQQENIRCGFLDGSVPVAKRSDIVNNFNDPKNPMKVLLLSLTAGGVGLNLVGGNHLLLIDLHWNPQLESQAQDRIYRVGQTKPVFIYKLLTLNTIEERIHDLQEKKLQMATDVLSGTKVQPGSKLSLDDLKMLFSV